MRTRWVLALVTLALMGLSLPSPTAQGTRTGEGQGGEAVFEVNLVRAGDVAGGLGSQLQPIGNDPLVEGVVEVDEDGQVQIEVRGAAQNKDYRLIFCRTGFERNCIGIGNFRTDGNGNAEAEFMFPLSDTVSGLFVVKDLSSGGPGCGQAQCIQFVNGFRIR